MAAEVEAESHARIAEADRDKHNADASVKINAENNRTQREALKRDTQVMMTVFAISAVVVISFISFVFVLLFMNETDRAIEIMQYVGTFFAGGAAGGGGVATLNTWRKRNEE